MASKGKNCQADRHGPAPLSSPIVRLPLPDREWIELWEALTWLATGRAITLLEQLEDATDHRLWKCSPPDKLHARVKARLAADRGDDREKSRQDGADSDFAVVHGFRTVDDVDLATEAWTMVLWKHQDQLIAAIMAEHGWTLEEMAPELDAYVEGNRAASAAMSTGESMLFDAASADAPKVRLIGRPERGDRPRQSIPPIFFAEDNLDVVANELTGYPSGGNPLGRPGDRRFWLDVKVNRDDLATLFGGSEAGTGKIGSRSGPSHVPSVTHKALCDWFRTRVAGWPKNTAYPSRDIDIRAAEKAFPGVKQKQVIDARRESTPEAWRRRGRRGP